MKKCNDCKGCQANGCCPFQYGRSIGLGDDQIDMIISLFIDSGNKLNELFLNEIASKKELEFMALVEKEGDQVLNRYPQPSVFQLVQQCELIEGVGGKTDIKRLYYDAFVFKAFPGDKLKSFEKALADAEVLALGVRALIIQRADQLAQSLAGVCALQMPDCPQCWLAEVCRARAKAGRDI